MGFWKAGFGNEDEEKQTELTVVREPQKDLRNVKTVFAAGAHVEGRLAFESDVQIDGYVKGSIVAQSLLVIGKSGELEAQLDVGELVVEGTVIGNINSRSHVHIASTGRVIGDIRCSSLSIEKGGYFSGTCMMDAPQDLQQQLEQSRQL